MKSTVQFLYVDVVLKLLKAIATQIYYHSYYYFY